MSNYLSFEKLRLMLIDYIQDRIDDTKIESHHVDISSKDKENNDRECCVEFQILTEKELNNKWDDDRHPLGFESEIIEDPCPTEGMESESDTAYTAYCDVTKGNYDQLIDLVWEIKTWLDRIDQTKIE